MASIKDLLKGLVISWNQIFSANDSEELFLEALIQSVRDEAGSEGMPWTKEDLRELLRYKVDLEYIQLSDLPFGKRETEFSRKLSVAFDDVALIPGRTNTPFDFQQITHNVITRTSGRFIESLAKGENNKLLNNLLIRHATDQGLKVDELYAIIVEQYPMLEAKIALVDNRLEEISSMTTEIAGRISNVEKTIVELRNVTPERARQLKLSVNETQSLLNQLDNYEVTMRMYENRWSRLASTKEIPPQEERDFLWIERQVGLIRKRLGLE
jgi:hypothetical protein